MGREKVGGFGLLVPLDRVIVVGKTEPVEIFTLLPADVEWGAIAAACFNAVDQRDEAKLLVAEDLLSKSDAPGQIKRLYHDRARVIDFEPRSLDSK